jgi:prepilin-type N-terminal cleavage/methylation domain-containing protein
MRRQGFTLLELMLVMAVIVLIAALCFPSLDSLLGAYKAQAAADSVRAAWASARVRAMDEGRAYRFAVVPGSGNYRVAPDDDSYWTGGDPPDQDPEHPALTLEDILPQQVRFEFQGAGGDAPASSQGTSSQDVGSVDPGQWVPVAVFQPDGTAAADCEITFSGSSTRSITLQLRALTGLASVKPDQEDQRP